MNRTTTITALACGLLLTSGVAAPAHASPPTGSRAAPSTPSPTRS
ncbi:hypothetical protein Q0F99_06550 [Rathayibacter oskolensis]|nr:hypothetical protein [Rathayibacter oskolensis]WKK72589.1 hypothetical protein Q0F99_06550 [Rathayibacter oskolensis]